MTSFIYNEAKRAIAEKEVDLGAGGDDIRVLLVMTNTTADTEKDVNTIGAFTALDEFDGGGAYTAGGLALASEVVNEDAANNRAEFTANNALWATLTAGSRQIQAALVYKFQGGSVANSLPIAFIDSGGFPFFANGSSFQITWNAEGIIQIA